MANKPIDEKAVFNSARRLASPEERLDYLQTVCGQDPDALRRILDLLEVYDREQSFLESPAVAPGATTDDPVSERPGSVIGPYRLLEQIGEGGFGVVFMAEQTQPVRRKVALKVLKPGMDTRQVVARFEAERQALALMDHPHIAKVLDGGETATGRPFFVMELVKGVPITRYCDEHRLTPKQRLELFVPVCHAVQHAHQKGIIHRDLKPSNVLVALYDDRPVPKVIDFGVAKATGQQLTEQTLHTGFGAVVGTVEYMSPEQAGFNQLDVDTRSDIYSLGVLLYELLTGGPPFSRKELEQAGVLEMLRVIREQEPSKPSTKLSTAEGLPSLAANRGTEPRRLAALVRGELDWIVMKALEKDRARRYETANGFALDIQRYLADEPVQACPPSAWYRLRKFARRNRTALAVGGLVLFCIALLGGGGGWVVRDRAVREEAAAKERLGRQQRLTARVEQILEDVDRLERDQKWPETQAAAVRAESVLGGSEADDAVRRRVAGARRELAFVAALDRIRQARGATTVEGRFNHAGAARDYALAFRDYGVDPGALPTDEAVARLRGNPALAVPVAAALDDWVAARRALGEGEPNWEPLVAVARGLDPDPLRDRLRAAWGRPVTEVQADLRQLAESIDVKSQSPATLIALDLTLERAQLADSALRILQEGQYAYPADFWLSFNLGFKLWQRKDYGEAVRYFTAAVSLRPDSAIAHNNLGTALHEHGKLEEAVAECRKAIALDPKLAPAHNNLGAALEEQGKLDGAVAECRKAIDLDPKLAPAHSNLGNALRDQGKLDEAIAEYRKAIALDPKLAPAHSNLGNGLRDQGKLDEAVAEYRRALEIDPKYAPAHIGLGNALHDQGQLDEAVAEYRRALEIDPNNATAHYNLGNALLEQNKTEEAVIECRRAIALDPKNALAHLNLGAGLKKQGQLDEAVAEYRQALEIDPNNATAHSNLGNALSEQGKLEEAIAEYRKAIKIHPEDAKAHIGLGNALRDQGKRDEAVAEYRKVIDLDPKNAKAHDTLGCALHDQGKLDEAVAEFRKAADLDPKDARAHNNLGNALNDQGKRREAGAEFRKAIDLDPKYAMAHYNLGNALWAEGKLDDGITCYRKAIALKPDYADAHCNLGHALLRLGEFRQALEELRRGHELGSNNSNWRYPSAEWVRRCERLVELDGKLPGFLEDKAAPASPGERIELATLCALKHLNRASARFYEDAFAAQTKLADDLGASHRYNAACAAALAGCGQGKDADQLDAKEKARLRGRALAWLRADLEAMGRLLDKGADPARSAAGVGTVLRHWQVDPDLAGVRGAEALGKLPEAERQAWKKLWDDAAGVLARAQARATPEKKPGAK
jgi:tetratricopeptide (TPR) repeat protein/serine/threonine protein kinase